MPTVDELLERIQALEAQLSGETSKAPDGLTAPQRAANVRAAEDAKWSEVNVNDSKALHAYLADHEARISAIEGKKASKNAGGAT